ncbi:MAG: Phosphoenolpyruvate carboxylase [Flavobacteriales bacterium]|nr:MAG: Phosphoenolpyruvate carboxylase [Flavobacteriales bacterium]
MNSRTKLERFESSVLSKFKLYDSIFSTLPYSKITNTATLLPLFAASCVDGYENGEDPKTIVEGFFSRYFPDFSNAQQTDLLFRFIQFIERRVVLFDAVEDAAFSRINNMSGIGTLRNLKEEAQSKQKTSELKELLQEINVRPVLTAHPTQFYPGSVLGIITDLGKSIQKNDSQEIKLLLAQLGRTPFFKKKKPTPLDEARSLIWYLSNVFYPAIGEIQSYVQRHIFQDESLSSETVKLGFWPGGDRDGNPFVTTEITRKTAQLLRSSVIRNYYRDIRKLRRRLTFAGVEEAVLNVEKKLYNSIFKLEEAPDISLSDLKSELNSILNKIEEDYHGLFSNELRDFIAKVNVFGYHFASLDIRQDSRVHHDAFLTLLNQTNKTGITDSSYDYKNASEKERISFLTSLTGDVDPDTFEDETVRKALGSIRAMKEIQQTNGEAGSNRYIISNNQTAQNIFEVFAMIRLSDWTNPAVDVVPLFETIPDLKIALEVMDKVYSNPVYREHLSKRGNKQTIMLGFSDGTKDGGYLMANWSIFKAKEELTAISRKHGIKVTFFDGRGGPPARGGGNTHQFYASMGSSIEADEIQLTVQGQTISSNFGTYDSCRYNLEQLLSSGISNRLFADKTTNLDDEDRATMNALADISYEAYKDFKAHPKFLPYLEHMSTLQYYAKTNIGSRPSKRKSSKSLDFSALRAIPFVGSWSQLKQNVPGFYGVGTALEALDKAGDFDKALKLYQNNAFFRTLISNSMMSLQKSFFKLTAYMEQDPEYGAFWKIIYEEFLRSKKYILMLTGLENLMQDQPAGKASITIREEIVQPLLTIQQYALLNIQQNSLDDAGREVMEKMVTRSLFGNINASRNSA